jgi:hypothetical protein
MPRRIMPRVFTVAKLRPDILKVKGTIMNLRVGDLVEVRSKEEILATLDMKGRMEGLPFMPQMFQYCGQRFNVYKRAHKTCDFVYTMKSRWLPNGVHLDLRCDGVAYGGCQHACLLYWKEAWLKRVHGDSSVLVHPLTVNKTACTEADVFGGTHTVDEQNEVICTCQGTEIPDFTKPLSWWDIRQYVEDYTSGNAGIGRLFKGFAYGMFSTISNAGIKLGRPLRWFYDAFEVLWGPYPRKTGKIPQGQSTPTCDLNLQPGELVRVKSYNEILATLNKEGKNRGLFFDAELVPYCGKVFRVKTRVTTFIDEKTRKLVTVKNPCIILENVFCQSRYSNCRMMCPRSIYSWWREIWLERVPESAVNTVAETLSS